MAEFYQFSPVELYRKVIVNSSEDAASSENSKSVIRCWPEILLLFGRNIYRYKNRNARFQADLLKIGMDELRYTIKALTGKSYTDFVEDFLVLQIQEVLGDYPKRGTIEQKANDLGFSYSGLYRFMKRKTKSTPTGMYWYSYAELNE